MSMNFIFAAAEGKGDGGRESPRFRARRSRRVFLYVSDVNAVTRKEKMAKKIMVHCVQRHDLRTVTKEPITGLEMVSVKLTDSGNCRRKENLP